MRSAVTVSLVSEARSGPFVFSDGLAGGARAAAELGFDAIELFPTAPEEVPVAELRTLLERHSLALAAVGTGAGWLRRQLTLTSPDANARDQAIGFIGRMLEVAAPFRAPVIIGSMQGRYVGDVTRSQALAFLAEALTQLNATAATLGMHVLYEPLNRYETNLFNRLGDAAAWLRQHRWPHVMLLADLFHMNMEEADSPAALRQAGDLVGHVHFADSNRHAIGFGQTAVAPIITALREAGYAGYLSAEVFPLPGPASAAAQTIKAFREATKH